jgi:uncharacterized tellurite resistance protein B-like protein
LQDESKNLLLAKVLAATAWADGEITPDEAVVLEEVGQDLGLTVEEQDELRTVLEAPVGVEEAEAWSSRLLPALTTQEREDLLRRMEKIVATDPHHDPKEIRLLKNVRGAVEEIDGGESLVERIRRFFRTERKQEKVGGSTGGVLSTVLDRFKEKAEPTVVDPQQLEYATLFGAILYRVAFSDGDFTEQEASRLRTLLTGVFKFDEPETEQILAVIVSKAAEDLDRQRLCAAFNRSTEMDGRMRLLGCLFMIAEADGEISAAEMREMRLIANYLWIGARDFHRVRVRHWSEGGWRAN